MASLTQIERDLDFLGVGDRVLSVVRRDPRPEFTCARTPRKRSYTSTSTIKTVVCRTIESTSSFEWILPPQADAEFTKAVRLGTCG